MQISTIVAKPADLPAAFATAATRLDRAAAAVGRIQDDLVPSNANTRAAVTNATAAIKLLSGRVVGGDSLPLSTAGDAALAGAKQGLGSLARYLDLFGGGMVPGGGPAGRDYLDHLLDVSRQSFTDAATVLRSAAR